MEILLYLGIIILMVWVIRKIGNPI